MSKRRSLKKITAPAAKVVGGTDVLQLITIIAGSALSVYIWSKGHPVWGAVGGSGTFAVAYLIGK